MFIKMVCWATVIYCLLLSIRILKVSADRSPAVYKKITYDLNLNFHENALLGNESYIGVLRIIFEFFEKNKNVHLHTEHNYISINNIFYRDGNKNVSIKNYKVNKKTNTLNIQLPDNSKNLTSHEILIEYKSRISVDDMNGLFRVEHVAEDGSLKYMVLSNFAPIYARRVFPCLDEPAFKAVVILTVVLPQNMTVLFNSKVISKDPNNPLRTIFANTEPLSPFDLSIAIVDETFIKISECNSSTTVYAVKYHHENIQFLLDVSTKMKQQYCDILGTCLIRNLNIVSVPDIRLKSFGSWGLITSSDKNIVYEEVSSELRRQKTISNIAYTIAQQWFENIISIEWWSDAYIILGLNKYYEYYISHHVYPEFQFENQIILEIVQQSMELEASSEAQPLHINCDNDLDIISRFDDAPTLKGASILRMLSNSMGKINFNNGLHHLISERSLQSFNAVDFWTYLYEANNNSVSSLPARNISVIMNEWVENSGYPIVNVKFHEGEVSISQEIFSYTAHTSDTEWYIPITYTLSTDTNKFDVTNPIMWLKPNTGEVDLLTLGDSEWIIVNNQVVGYYRVNYDNTLWQRIIKALDKDNFGGVTVMNRAQIIDDAFNLARAGKIEYPQLFRIIRFLKKDTSYYTWYSALMGFNFLLKTFGEESDLGNEIKGELLRLLDMVFQSVNKMYSEKEEESQIHLLKYNLIMKWACRLGQSDCLQISENIFRLSQLQIVRPNKSYLEVIACNAMIRSDSSQWNDLFISLLKSPNKLTENLEILRALGCSREKEILKRYLEMTIQQVFNLSQQYYGVIFKSVYENSRMGFEVALEFLHLNYEKISQCYEYLDTITELICGMASKISSKSELEMLSSIVTNAKLSERQQRTAHKALKNAENNLKWSEEYSKIIRIVENDSDINLVTLFIALSVVAGIVILATGVFCIYKYKRFRLTCFTRGYRTSSDITLVEITE